MACESTIFTYLQFDKFSQNNAILACLSDLKVFLSDVKCYPTS